MHIEPQNFYNVWSWKNIIINYKYRFVFFCFSYVKDLTYKYSICVGDGAPRILYQGRDFQYYFRLPQGDPNDDLKGKNTHSSLYLCIVYYSQKISAKMLLLPIKRLFFASPVTIYTEIRSSMYGTATRPCPVTVQVQPSFLRDASTTHLDPDLEL